jgi:hypothetical protein
LHQQWKKKTNTTKKESTDKRTLPTGLVDPAIEMTLSPAKSATSVKKWMDKKTNQNTKHSKRSQMRIYAYYNLEGGICTSTQRHNFH